jgi:RNA polymerase sigma-70 factor (ECF subfamily)
VISDLDVSSENDAWVQALSGVGPQREEATERLYGLLLQAARREARRQARRLYLSGPEVDDVAHQAAGDALMAVTRKVETFRGESRFTTWAYRFVIFDVGTKVNRHFWWRGDLPLSELSLPVVDAGVMPGDSVELRDLVEAIRDAVSTHLTERQRWAFIAAVIEGVPLDAMAEELGATRNSLYKLIHDARRKLRTALAEGGYLPADVTSHATH